MTDCGSGSLGAWSGNARTLDTTWGTADVGIVGDSITVRGYPVLRSALAGHSLTLAVDAQGGRPTTPAVDALLARPQLPATLIMATGTNDIFDPTVMATQVARVVNGVAALGVEHLLWVDVQCCRTSKTAAVQLADQRNTGWVNDQIHAGVPTARSSRGSTGSPRSPAACPTTWRTACTRCSAGAPRSGRPS